MEPVSQSHPLYFPPPPRKSMVVSSQKTNQRLRPILKKTKVAPRQGFALALLLLSLIVLTLSIIFASCVALPHTISSDESVKSIPSGVYLRDDVGTTTQVGSDASMARQGAMQNEQAEHDRYSTPTAMAALGFYALTLPFLTMLHSALELMILCIRPETLHNRPMKQAGYRKILPILSLVTSVLLVAGWIPMNIIWMNCEIAGFTPIAVEKICPVQIRGHRMGGVDELSIAKVVFTWVIVFVYISYVVFCRYSAQRAAHEDPGLTRFSSNGDEAESIIIRLEEDVVKDIKN